MDQIKYPYSKKNGIVTISVMLILGILFLSNIVKAYNNADKFDLFVFAVFLVILTSVMVIVVMKRLIPAFNNQTALELTNKEIIDYTRNITINWQDIKAVGVKRSRSTLLIRLDIKWESDYGSQIFISLRWIEGKDEDIYNTVLSYFDALSGPNSVTEV